MGSVVIVLLIACANIAGLMSARGLSRESEIAVRRALGAGRARIVRQLLTEGLVLALLGAGLGAALGLAGSSALVGLIADQFPTFVRFDLDWRFLAFLISVTVGSTVLFGLVPALQASRTDALRGAGKATSSGRRRRALDLLVSAEVGLALALLVLGGLTARDISRLGGTDPGFDTQEILTYNVSLPSARYTDATSRKAFWDDYLERLGAIPGVVGTAASSGLPMTGSHWGWFFEAEGVPERTEEDGNPVVLHRVVTPGYLQTMGVEMASGRTFQPEDGRDEGNPVVIVNETFARIFFGEGVDPVGRRISGNGDDWMTIVGVARDVRHYGVTEEMRPGVYQPLEQYVLSGMAVALRTGVPPESLAGSVRAVTAEIDPELPVFNLRTMEGRMDDSLRTQKATSWLIASFSTIALLLAVAGIYGVISYGVAQRRREIGIRLAMGAERGQVSRQVVQHGMVLVAMGVAIGLTVSVAAAGLVGGFLVSISPTDPVVYGLVTTLLVAVAALANYVPARRAAKLDPVSALRSE